MTDSTPKQELALPVVADLMADDSRWDETGLLPACLATSPLRIEVPAWGYTPKPNERFYLNIFWDEKLLDRRELDGGVPTLPANDLIFDIPVAQLTQGAHELHYVVVNSDGNSNDSLRQIVTVDVIAPVLNAASGQLEFDTATITEQYLNDHDNKVIGIVPVYSGGKAGDVVTWYWSKNAFNFTEADVVSTRILEREEVGKPVALEFGGDMILSRKDGTRYAFYRLRDRAGNLSPYSRPFELEVKAQPAPRVLPPPRVTQATGSAATSTLNPIHAIHGATVTIPDDAVIRAGETVSVQWAEPESVGSYLTSKEDARTFTIPSTCIAQHFGKSIPVYYEVHESGVADPHVSNTHTLKVLTISGFPVVQCDKVSGGRLSLGSIADGGRALFTLGSWPFMDTSQFITIQVIGLSVGGQNLTIDVLKESPVPHVADTIDVGHITKTDLQRFKTGGLLEVHTKVSFDEKASWMPFGSLRPTLSN